MLSGSVNPHTLFLGRPRPPKQYIYFCQYWQLTRALLESADMTVEIILRSITTKVTWPGLDSNPRPTGSAVRHTSGCTNKPEDPDSGTTLIEFQRSIFLRTIMVLMRRFRNVKMWTSASCKGNKAATYHMYLSDKGCKPLPSYLETYLYVNLDQQISKAAIMEQSRLKIGLKRNSAGCFASPVRILG